MSTCNFEQFGDIAPGGQIYTRRALLSSP